MSKSQLRRLHFRSRQLTPEQLAAAQEATWAEKNWEEFASWMANCCGLFPERPADLIEWNRRDLPF